MTETKTTLSAPPDVEEKPPALGEARKNSFDGRDINTWREGIRSVLGRLSATTVTLTKTGCHREGRSLSNG